jgi:hypothetical protein
MNPDALVADARAFMEQYALDLRSAARSAIAERYDPRGAFIVGQGEKRFLPRDSIRAHYLGTWRPPASFAFDDLSYEPVGPEAIMVVGRFRWRAAGGPEMIYSYTGLLVRVEGKLRIRLEDESQQASFTPQRTPYDPLGATIMVPSDDAAQRVTSIVTLPQRVALRVGDSLLIGVNIRATGFDTTGRPVTGFSPGYFLRPSSSVALRSGWVVALAPGDGELVVRAVPQIVRPSVQGVTVMARVPITVRP